MRYLSLFWLLFFVTHTFLFSQETRPARFEIDVPVLVLSGVPFQIDVTALDDRGSLANEFVGRAYLMGVDQLGKGSEPVELTFSQGRASAGNLVLRQSGRKEVRVQNESSAADATLRVIPGVLSILPPLLAIALALIFRHVIISLYAGIWLGAIFLFDFRILAGFFHVLDYFVVNALIDTSHLQIIVFSMLFGGMVGIITRNGGTRGIADVITSYARTARGGQLAAWAMAFFLFFDDYANVLVRGNLMRPITDRLRISREKLAFLVDTGAATVASVFIISTWIGYEVGLIAQGWR